PAYETLRRDQHARALLDLPGRSWTALLKALLGSPHPALAAAPAGRGVLLRLLIGEALPGLLRDDDLVLTLCLAAPTPRRRSPRPHTENRQVGRGVSGEGDRAGAHGRLAPGRHAPPHRPGRQRRPRGVGPRARPVAA